ncbi:dymeclin [Coccinella septempunctata]|uniref:dymeclin n=1 Tax=Coccinella septempunctata TaxID=41139 RepID=UPI001D07D86A|nr:dymeclin [Coccinella septempunctata]
MGIAISKDLDFHQNDYLKKFVSQEVINLNDPFWNRLLTFNLSIPTNRHDQLAFESRIEPCCQELLRNNSISGNFGTLIDLFLIRSSELLAASNSDADLFNWQLFNVLFILRSILKFFMEILSEEEIIKQIEINGDNTRLESLIGALVGTLVDVPIKDSTYAIHLEATTTLLVLLSVPIYAGKRPDDCFIYRLIMKGKHIIHAPLLIKKLIANFIKQERNSYRFGSGQGNSIVLGIASGIWSMLTFNSKSSSDGDNLELANFHEVPLASQSLLLVLVLVHHWTTHTNPYRSSLFSCANYEDNTPILPTKDGTLFKLDFSSFYETLCKRASGEAETLLLYLLLHRNSNFKKYLLSRLDIEQLVIPILKTLYNAPTSNSHHIYMSLIILLILSEDDSFNKTIHETKLKHILWYTERVLNEISLGGLLILVVIRTIQYNMLKMRDKYLHTNCLAALANMSAEFRDLHPYVSQRLVSLFETLAKKYQRLVQNLDKIKNGQEISISMKEDSDLEQDVSVLEEVLRMLLEILNSCLSNQLIQNPNLVYTLLYKKQTFEMFKNNVVFQDIIHNIEIILQYFSQLLTDKSQQYEVDATQVLLTIQQGSKSWPKEKLTRFPELKFKYVEEESPEEFFIPYVWELVNQQSFLHINNENNTVIATC